MKNKRGSILIHVIVALAVISGVTFALLARAVSSQEMISARRIQNEAMLLEDAARAAVRAAMADAARTGDYNSVGSKVSVVLNALALSEWAEINFSGNLAISNLLAKSQVAVGGDFGTAFDGSSLIGPRIEHALDAQVSLHTVLKEADTINRNAGVSVEVLEVPSVEFQLIATDGEFIAETGSTPVSVDGKALLNGGLKRSFTGGLTVTSEGAVLLPVRTQGSYSDLNTPSGLLPRASWGLTDTSHLSADPAEVPTPNRTVAFDKQNYPTYISTLPTGRSVVWTDPSVAPAALPLGVSFQHFNGAQRIVVNLSTYVAEDGLFIQCSEATKDIGVVVAGSNSPATAPAIIATNGRLTLYGNNERPVLLSSSYLAGPTLVSPGFTGAAGMAATDTVWRGYLVLPMMNLSFNTAEDWSGRVFTLFGTVLFKGGTIKGIPSLALKSDSSLKASLQSLSMNSDRFVLTFARLSQP